MKKNYLTLFAIFTNIVLSSSILAQKSYPINYSTSGLPTSLCNVFNVAHLYSIGGLVHYPASGGVTFDGTALNLVSYGTNLLDDYGTAYAIKFPFKKGYTYTISAVIYKSSSDPVALPMLNLGVFNDLGNPISTKATACGAVSQNAYAYFLNNILFQGFISNTSSSTITFGTYTLSADGTYLTILVHGGSN
jgi:hypothetical protein